MGAARCWTKRPLKFKWIKKSVVPAPNGPAGIQSNYSSGGTASGHLGAPCVQVVGDADLLNHRNNQVTGIASNGSFTGTASLQ